MKVLTDNTGENAKRVNPFKTGNEYFTWFDKRHPSLPLTERQLPNVIIEVEVVWQYRFYQGSMPFVNIPKKVRLNFDSFIDFDTKIKSTGQVKETRQAYKPITPIDEEKGLEVTGDDNVLIAEFMGYRYETGVSLSGSWSRYFKIGGTFDDSFPVAKYKTSWDWLMPVVEKIYTLSDYRLSEPYYNATHCLISTPIDIVYRLVVKFIKWYNTQNS